MREEIRRKSRLNDFPKLNIEKLSFDELGNEKKKKHENILNVIKLQKSLNWETWNVRSWQ